MFSHIYIYIYIDTYVMLHVDALTYVFHIRGTQTPTTEIHRRHSLWALMASSQACRACSVELWDFGRGGHLAYIRGLRAAVQEHCCGKQIVLRRWSDLQKQLHIPRSVASHLVHYDHGLSTVCKKTLSIQILHAGVHLCSQALRCCSSSWTSIGRNR